MLVQKLTSSKVFKKAKRWKVYIKLTISENLKSDFFFIIVLLSEKRTKKFVEQKLQNVGKKFLKQKLHKVSPFSVHFDLVDFLGISCTKNDP